jgi:NAD(P)-dependent dehydrogenase (short-subunit alcohol dehydrogenase family)
MNQPQRFDLTNKVAIVTGAAGLLGLQHCHALLESGASVVLTDLNQAACDEAAAKLKTTYPQARILAQAMDVSKEESVRTCLDVTLKKFSRVDVLVNNAAIDPKVKNDATMLEQSRLENYSLESWNFQVSVGLTGAFLCSKVFGAEMARQGTGVILNIASDLAVIAPDQRLYQKADRERDQQPVKPVTYSVIKAGLVGLTRYLATYWADRGVRVNSLSPGGVYNGQPEEFVQKLTKLIPQGRMAKVDEYRGCIQFLCSDASSYINGQNLVADGGRSVW